MNLDRRAGPAWRMYESPKGTSVYPSCGAIPTAKATSSYGVMIFCCLEQRYGESWIDEADAGEDELMQRVLEALSDRETVSRRNIRSNP